MGWGQWCVWGHPMDIPDTDPKWQSLSDLADSILVITFPQHSPHRNQSPPLQKAFDHVRTQRPCTHTPYQLLVTCFPTCTMGGLTLRSSSRSGLTWPNQWPNFFFFLRFLFIYVTERQPVREGTQQGSGRGRSRLPAEEPDVGLDPRMPGSRPEPKADA